MNTVTTVAALTAAINQAKQDKKSIKYIMPVYINKTNRNDVFMDPENETLAIISGIGILFFSIVIFLTKLVNFCKGTEDEY